MKTGIYLAFSLSFFSTLAFGQKPLGNVLVPGKIAMQSALSDLDDIDWKDSAFSPRRNWKSIEFESNLNISYPEELDIKQAEKDGSYVVETMADGTKHKVLTMQTLPKVTYDPILGSTPVSALVNINTEKTSQPTRRLGSGSLMVAPNLPDGNPEDFSVSYNNPREKPEPIDNADDIMTEAYDFTEGQRTATDLGVSVGVAGIGANIHYGLGSAASVTVTLGIQKNDLIKAAQSARNQLPFTVENMNLSIHPAYAEKFWVKCTRSFSASMDKAYAGSLEVKAGFSPLSPMGGIAAGATFTSADFRSNVGKLLPEGELMFTKLEQTRSFSQRTGQFDMQHYFDLCWSQFKKKDIDRLWKQTKGFYSPIFQNLIYRPNLEEEPCENIGETLHPSIVGPGEQRECMQAIGHPKGIGIQRHVWTRKGRHCFLYRDGSLTQVTDKEKTLDPKTNQWIDNETLGWYRYQIRGFHGAHFCSPAKKLRCAARYQSNAWMTGKCVSEEEYKTYISKGWMNWKD